ncbi:MAG: hypothetical protein ACE5GC_01640 [Acidimicrobiia bacterium]
MFYRVTHYEFEDERYDEILAWSESTRSSVERIRGLEFVDEFRSGPGEGVIVAAYRDEASFIAASETIMSVFSDMNRFVTAPPQTYSGTADMSFGR